MVHLRVIHVLSRGLPGPLAAGAAAILIGCGGPTGSEGGGGTSSGSGGEGSGPTSEASSSAATSGSGSGGSTGRCAVLARDLAVSGGKGANPAIAWGGGHFGVAWTSLAQDKGDIVFALLDDKGNKLKETAVDVGPGAANFASVVRSPSGYVVLWQVSSGNGSSIRGRLLRDDGTPAGDAFPTAESQSPEARPEGAPHGSGGDVIVAWSDTPGSFMGRLSGSTLSDKRPIELASEPVPSAAGDALGVVWLSGSKLGFSRFSHPLEALMPVTFRDAAGRPNLPRLAAHADGSFDVAWEDDRRGSGEESVYVTRIGEGGKVGSETLVPSAPGSANVPDLVWTGAHTFVAYYQFRDGPSAIFLNRMSADLTRAEEELQVSGDHGARAPRLAWTGDTLGVAYAEKDGPVRLSLVTCP